jgi:hypothetical protein
MGTLIKLTEYQIVAVRFVISQEKKILYLNRSYMRYSWLRVRALPSCMRLDQETLNYMKS